MKIIGATVGTMLPKPNFDQIDPKKGDYIKGDRSFLRVDDTLTESGISADAKAVGDALAEKIGYNEQTLTDEQKAQARANIGAGIPQIQSDWNQSDTTELDYIKNKPQEISDEEFIAWLNEENIVSPVATASGELYVTNNNEIYVL